jgi:hypothetical protein
MPSPLYPYIDLSAALNYSEASSGDIDTYTAYTDTQGYLAHYAWVMNQPGANIWSASINSPSDSADVIHLSIPTGYAVDGYSLSITSSTINSSAFFDFGTSSGTGFDDNRALSNFSSTTVVGTGLYSITIGSGTNVLSYTLQLNMIKVNEAPTITEDALYPTFYTGGAPADLFSNVLVSNEAGQHITQMTLTVYEVVAADSEFLTIGNADIRLADGQSGTLSNGVAFTTTDSNGSIVVSLVMPANTTSQTLQALLDGMTYKNTSASPTEGDRYIELTSVSDDGGTAKTGSDTRQLGDGTTLTVAAPLNAAPVVTTDSGSAAFNETAGGTSTPVTIDASLIVIDSDNTTLLSAKVSVSNHFNSAQDVLLFTSNGTSMGDISGSYNASTGVLKLTSAGSATVAQWQEALRSIAYSNSSHDPDTSPRTISYVVNDGTSDSAIATRDVTLTAANDAPVLTTTGATTSFTEGNNVTSTPVVVDSGLSLDDIDNLTLASATVAITSGGHSAEDTLGFTNNPATMGNIVAAYHTDTGVLDLTSAGATATLAQWQAALRSVTYSDSSDTPNTSTRTISFTVNDGAANSNVGTKSVSVTSVNDAPIATVSGGSSAFTEGADATSTPVIVDGGLTVSDLDSVTLSTAKVSITTHFKTAEDALLFVNDSTSMGNINGVYHADTGVLDLASSGSTATLAQWQAALRSVAYTDTSDTPDTNARTITFVVNDGSSNSAVVQKTVTVTSVNDAPEITLAAATQSVRQDTALVFNTANHNLIRIDDVDAGSSEVQVTLSTTNGSLTLGSTTGLTFTGNGQDVVLVTGTLAAINAGLNGLKFAPTTGFTGSASINVLVDDLGLGDDHQDPLTANTSLAITITPTPITPVTPPVTVDGVPVTSTSVTLPDGETGSSVSVGLVTDSRVDSTGNASTADIDLVGSGSGASLSAKLPVGYGLTAAAGAVKTVANSAETLKAAIDAVTANTDQAHQNVNGQHFLDKLADGSSLLVTTVTPVTASTAPTQALELDGSSGSQLTALVIDAGQMGGKGSLVLNNVDFAAVVGQTTVQGNTTGQVLTGDDASQSFIVNASDSFVFAGGGSDTLQITSFAAANNTVLQGGQGNDTVQFSGNSSLYNIEQHGGFTIVSSKDDPNQQVKVVNVESLSFADGAVSIPTDTQQTTLAALYEGLLGRQADVAGFDYWTQQSLSIGGIGLSILNSTEAGAKALNGDTSHDIAAMYTAFFGRAADAAGQAYWTEQVQQGHLTFVQVADSLLTSTEMASHNKAPATWDFTV